ncbi:MAG: gamma-glutamylcyclotransferase [Deltaproteobacteria bacterium]|nr:gamma-glutamylcyclotransferase [Deltaproteobacteria bacterium]
MPRAFVYGALMAHPHVLATGEAASVDDHEVRFVYRGLPLLEPSFAALEPSPGGRAWGVLVEWSDEAWARVCRRERGYDTRKVVARSRRSAEVECLAFVVTPWLRTRERTPSARYARLLLRGAEHHALPAEVIERYRALAERGARWSTRLSELFR